MGQYSGLAYLRPLDVEARELPAPVLHHRRSLCSDPVFVEWLYGRVRVFLVQKLLFAVQMGFFEKELMLVGKDGLFFEKIGHFEAAFFAVQKELIPRLDFEALVAVFGLAA